MATGPNWAGLDKGLLAQGTAAYEIGELVKLGTVPQSCAKLTAAATATDVVGVVIEDIDAAKVATGKAFIGVRLGGIAPVRVGTASLPKGTRIINNAAGRAVAAGAAGTPAIGILLEAGGAVGTLSEVILTPGVTV